MIHLRLKLFRCSSCRWQGQTYCNPQTTAIECPGSGCNDMAEEIPSKFNEAGNKLIPLEAE